jgi:hypothetical protein
MKAINKSFNRKQLAKDMLAKRTKENLSTRKAADQAKVNYQTFNNVEFEKDCKPATLGKLCNWLGVQVQKYF